MPLCNAVVRAFGNVATGGFRPKTASVGFYDSLAVEAIIAFFMVAPGVSFSLYYLINDRVLSIGARSLRGSTPGPSMAAC